MGAVRIFLLADASRVDAGLDPRTGSSVVSISFTAAEAKTWAEWTGQHIGKQITGKFTLPEARQPARDIAGG